MNTRCLVTTKFLLAAALLVFLSSAVFAQDIYVNYNRSLDFSQYHTYAWGQEQNPNQIGNSFLAQEAQNQVNAQLQSKGLKMVQETETPDLLVVGSGGLKVQTSYNSWGTGGWGWGGGMASITPEQNVVGTLVIDIYDAKAKQLAWRGIARDTLNQSKSQKNMEMVDKAVAKMFKKYPYPENGK